jgi:site-specific DNA recombinase
VVCVEPFIDFSTPTGQLVGMIMAWLAEQELAQITQRSNDTKLYLQDNGYVTGKAPFGYRIVADRDHKSLEPDPVQAELVREAVRMYLDGASLRTVADWLDVRCTAPQGDLWSAGSLSNLFRNPVLIGRRTDAKGKTILRAEPILDRATWNKLQAKQSARAKTTGTIPKSLLTGIAICGLCGGPMYRLASAAKGKKYTYYRCHGNERNPSKCRNMIRLETLDAHVEEFINGPFGDHPASELITIPGHGHEDEIAEVEQDLRELAYDASDFLDRQAELLAERKRLRALPMIPTRTEPVLTGDKIRDYWATLDTDGKRAYLNRISMTVKVFKGEDPVITIFGGLTGLRPGIQPVALRV